MTTEEARPEALPPERFVARVFALADHAEAVTETGKMYVNGLGVGNVFTNRMPGALPPMFVILRLSIPWQKMTEPFTLRIRALNLDRTPVNKDPLVELSPEVGRPPGYRVGDEAAMNLVLGVGGMPIQEYGTINFHLEVDGDTIAVHPLKIIQLPSQIPGLRAR